MNEGNPSGAKAQVCFEGFVYGLKAAPSEFRSAPLGRRCSGPANPRLRYASPWAIFVFSLRETGLLIVIFVFFLREKGLLVVRPFATSSLGTGR